MLWGLSEYQVFSILMMVFGSASMLWRLSKQAQAVETNAPNTDALRA
jgi:hypothetical protein